jgi:phosphoglycolate phosphatase (TIGR01487 family)
VLKAVITDIDGTLTDEQRRLNTRAIETIRILQDNGVEVILASGNTSCILKGLSKLIGTSGTFIGENGGIYRIGFFGNLQVLPDRRIALEALDLVTGYYLERGITLDMYSTRERFADVAFARTVPVQEVRDLLATWNVSVYDTNFAIHIQEAGFSKGRTFRRIADELKIPLSAFLAIGDSENDTDMIVAAGTGCCVANSAKEVKKAAGYIAERPYGDGFVEVMTRFFPHILER